LIEVNVSELNDMLCNVYVIRIPRIDILGCMYVCIGSECDISKRQIFETPIFLYNKCSKIYGSAGSLKYWMSQFKAKSYQIK